MSDWFLSPFFQTGAVPGLSSAWAWPRSCPRSGTRVGLPSSGTQGATGALAAVLALLSHGVSTPVNAMLELAVLNITFINSCHGNWQIFINHLKRPPLPLGFAAAALEHGRLC